ncbi:MAG: Hsp20/alpha crystallin family protein [Bacteroidales bacterium]|nr:Hsp20/alpha crystallin family protein [Bacteroidales bacterium]MBN2758101.1 Hsp20/alpha crystallin family protein [Bacteroidales bacterium]
MTLIRRVNHNYPNFTNLLEDIFGNVEAGININRNSTLPSVNIAEEENLFKIEFAVPGMEKNEFNINLDNNVLTVKSEKEQKNEEKNKNFTRREFNYTSFQRSFTLPDSANSEEIKAEYINGILQIEIPKKEEAKIKAQRKIEIM